MSTLFQKTSTIPLLLSALAIPGCETPDRERALLGDPPPLVAKLPMRPDTSIPAPREITDQEVVRRIELLRGKEYVEADKDFYVKLYRHGVSAEGVAAAPSNRIAKLAGATSEYSAERLEKIAFATRVYGTEGDWIPVSRWAELTKDAGVAEIRGLGELRDRRKKLLPAHEEALSPVHTPYWCVCLKNSVPLGILEKLDTGDLLAITKGFGDGRYPAKLWKEFRVDREEYSRVCAAADPDFSRGAAWANDYIKKALGKREHAFRPSTDYKEDASQVDEIKDVHQLFLIRQYLDFFNSRETWSAMAPLFPNRREEDKEEEGGFIIGARGKLEFVRIKQYTHDHERRGNESDSFHCPELAKLIGHIGVLHTHPGGPAFAGPSGYAKPSDGRYHPHGDTYSLSHYNQFNPRLVEVVVTELATGKYNVDLFLRDVAPGKRGALENRDPVIVIDLGVFEPEKEWSKP